MPMLKRTSKLFISNTGMALRSHIYIFTVLCFLESEIGFANSETVLVASWTELMESRIWLADSDTGLVHKNQIGQFWNWVELILEQFFLFWSLQCCGFWNWVVNFKMLLVNFDDGTWLVNSEEWCGIWNLDFMCTGTGLVNFETEQADSETWLANSEIWLAHSETGKSDF